MIFLFLGIFISWRCPLLHELWRLQASGFFQLFLDIPGFVDDFAHSILQYCGRNKDDDLPDTTLALLPAGAVVEQVALHREVGEI